MMTLSTRPIRQIVALFCSKTGAVSLNNLLYRLRNQRLQTSSPLPVTVCLQRFHVLTDQKLMCSDTPVQWIEIDQCNSSSLPLTDNAQNGVSLSEKLFQITDTLQVTGTLVDIIIEFPHELQGSAESLLSLCGALGHLKEWYNASVTTVIHPALLCDLDPLLADSHRQLCDFVKAKAVGCFEDFENNQEDVWRGKVSVIDKTVHRGYVLPGFVLKKCDGFDLGEEQRVWGRTLEVLDEVALTTIPAFMITKERYSLCLADSHPHSRAFVDQLTADRHTGIVARLACYNKPLDECSTNHNRYLNSTTWKESIMSDIMFVQEPEEELLSGYSYLHFLITSPRQPSPLQQRLSVTRLCPPEALNGSLMTLLFKNAVQPSDDGGKDEVDCGDILSELPALDTEMLEEFNRILWKRQTELLHQWLEEREHQGQGQRVKVSEVKDFFTNIYTELLHSLWCELPKFQPSCASSPAVEATGASSELEINPTEWQERQLLIFCESQKRTLSRLQSTDSVALSSPIQPAQEPTSIDIKDLLKMFKPDGTAANENLSPIRKKRQGRCKKSVVPNSEDLGQETIPTYLQSCCHDIYLNRDKKGERLDSHKQKLQERYIRDETDSSCSVPIFNLGKKKKKASSPQKSGKRPKTSVRVKPSVKSPLKTLRKSPRKNPSAKFAGADSNIRRSPRKVSSLSTRAELPQQLSPSQSNTDFLPLRRSPRKATSQSAFSSQRRHSLYEPAIRGGNARESTAPRGSRLSLSGTESRMNSSASNRRASETMEQQRVSRSERHKKKLQDIVDDVLQKNGVDRSSAIYTSCATRLFKVTKLYVMDLPTSENLRQEMRMIAEGQVQPVIDVETRRQSIGGKDMKGR
ncbi:mdm2-binding protein-like isoform X1 [Mizuhopecten yessoensis]|uniref:mdm2-binding protein-like isoform X1 n=2 Tax=Mizuhopecten yessoensis TaxID=6573 RepID=UPI000B457A78|nr:mdm2-binding protein-like isoform X1 [Mizuhopecten yessoensis]